MKIKVVDMPYEQALAQPREKHTPPRRPSMLFRALLRALSAAFILAGHHHQTCLCVCHSLFPSYLMPALSKNL